MPSAAWIVPNRLWNSESNKTPVISQGSRIKCNTCRDLQAGGPLVAEKLTELYFTLCEENKPSLKNSRMHRLSTYSNRNGILKSVTIIGASLYCQLHGRSCKSPTKPTTWTPWIIRASTRKSMWIQAVQRNSSHDLHSKTTSKEMPGTECGPQHDLCRPYQSIWYSRPWGTLENYGKIWLSGEFHSSGATVPRWHACKGPKWWQVFWSIPCDKWS